MKVNVQGVGLVEFPDDAKPEEITAALNQRFPVVKSPAGFTPQSYDEASRKYTEGLKSTDFSAATGGGIGGLVPRAINAVQSDIIEPAAANYIKSASGGLIKVESGKPLIPDEALPLAKEQGIIPALSRTLQGLSTPGNIMTLPLAAESKLVQGGFAAGAASSIPESLQRVVSAKTPEEQRDAATELGLNVAFAAMMGKSAIKEKPLTAIGETPSGKQLDTLGSQLKMPEGAQPLHPEQGPAPSVEAASKPTDVTAGIDFSNIQRPHFVGVEKGIELSADDVPTLKTEQEVANAQMRNALVKGDDETFKSAFGKSTFLSGVIEGAQKAGPNYNAYVTEKGLTPKTETTPENPPVISESGSKVKQGSEQTSKQPAGEFTGFTPAVKTESGQIFTGKDGVNPHQDIEAQHNLTGKRIRGYINNKTGEFYNTIAEVARQVIKDKQPEPVQKYRVGNNPTLHTVVEKPPATEVEISNGEQPVKVKNEKTGEVSTVLESDLTAVKESVGLKGKKQSVPDKLKSLGYSDAEISAMDKPGQKAIADRGFPKGQQSRGPGAAAAGEPGTYSAIQQLADQLEATAKDNTPVNEKVSAIEKAKNAAGDAKRSVEGSLSNVVAISKALWKSYSELSPFTDMKRIVGRWFYANQKADFEAREFGRQIVKAVPDKARREAITNWIQADGDIEVLKAREAASKGALKQGYKIAQSLTPRETEIAQLIREYYDRQLEKGISEGLLKEGLDNYITQVWKRENPVTRKLINELVNSKLQPNFKFARKRIFESYFEGEQAGYVPRTKDAGALVANYDQSFNKALAARAFIKELHEGKASDGRPLVELSGNGKVVEQAGERSIEQPKSILINPKAKPEEISDYRTIDHPALRGWKFAATSPDGAAVLLKGDMLVHPEIYAKLKNRLSTSWFRQHPVPRAVLNVQSTFKQSLMSISGFHQVQEGLHAIGHRVNPANLEKIDYSDPITKAGAEHGLQLSDYNALEQFGEGLSSGKLLNKVPFLGPKLKAYNDWLFQDYIPRLKLTMFKHALERNQERYADAIKSGKITPDQVIELTANQANHAFGELPYKYWGRNPNLQDFYRTFLLAPDFLESRAGFVGQAASPGGLGSKGLLKNEQFQALAFLALTQYMIARIVNQIVDKDPHFELKNAFRIIVGNHAISLRTVPGDILHLISEPRGFLYNRLSPIIGRGGIELATSRDYRGVKRDFIDQMKDLLKSGIPISLNHKYGQSFLETLGNAFGIQNQRYDAVQNIEQKAADWKAANGIKDSYETVYDPDADKFSALRNFIYEGKKDAAQKEFDRLKKEIPPDKIRDHFVRSLSRSITGSKENDSKFYNGLSDIGKEEFKESKDLKDARLNSVLSLKGMPQLSPDYQLRKISSQMRIKPNK